MAQRPIRLKPNGGSALNYSPGAAILPEIVPLAATKLILLCPEPALQLDAQRLAAQLQLPLLRHLPAATELYLRYDRAGLALAAGGPNAQGVLRADFTTARHRYRHRHALQQELLAKALGIKRHSLTIWDVTAGLGQDAWVLASLGHTVHLFERHPIIHALLTDGLTRARTINGDESARQILARMQLTLANSLDILTGDHTPAPDVVYLDPMFPEKRKNAKAKKAMQYFQCLVGEDPDSADLLAAALPRATYRVIVKRPVKAPPLSPQPPSAQLHGKTIRFDIYARQSAKRYLEEKNSQMR